MRLTKAGTKREGWGQCVASGCVTEWALTGLEDCGLLCWYGGSHRATLVDAMTLAKLNPRHHGCIIAGPRDHLALMESEVAAGLTGVAKSMNRSAMRVTLRNGGYVLFLRPNQAYRLHGFQLAWAYFADGVESPEVTQRLWPAPGFVQLAEE